MIHLSQEARDLIQRESDRSTYPMSTLIDMLIKERYGEPSISLADHVVPEAMKNPRIRKNVQELTSRQEKKTATLPPIQKQEPPRHEFKLDI